MAQPFRAGPAWLSRLSDWLSAASRGLPAVHISRIGTGVAPNIPLGILAVVWVFSAFHRSLPPPGGDARHECLCAGDSSQ